MTLQQAIEARHSVRQYTDRPIEPATIETLRQAIAEANEAGRLRLQLVTDEPKAFAEGMAKYGKFSGISNYIALVGPKGSDEAIGYYGEKIVLLAQTLGLNSCWVGLTFSKQPSHYTVEDGETLKGVIALGYGATKGSAHAPKPMEKFYKSAVQPLPDWFVNGLKAALLAPTAMNMQKFEFELIDNKTVALHTKFTLVSTYTKLDLGIVRYHFEVGAGTDNFVWQTRL